MYRRTYKQILGYALRRCSSPEDAADVVAETYVIAWRRITELPDGEADKLWLYGVARRVLANHRRSERRRLTRHTELTDEIAHLLPPPPTTVSRTAWAKPWTCSRTAIANCWR
ncbi:sigma-70 family RNA polymerase sigma factor [Nonomuraea glycinis]|uniref:RNA polymerase sigma-70 region 2 domain-containing protein n=1 Tax=Nonomuraea glycinis TaxID=2047744 RepID=A0A918E9N4_9ACTN|nr:sigma-70 family RNA polymerase sigma factor [Nonomuraea glycinis]MCA2181448.1 sigma-70 family RNA polymerase sigma factor [Nonomuraea glycinis]GGP14496.1 hypothetical protein GCM10012278_70530 [Nonomuraea glycinis]